MRKIPVLVLAFNRADHVTEAMKAIREYKPERIYLECDGARPNKEGEAEAVLETRKAMVDSVDWDCEIKTLFRDENMGCAKGVNDAISWFFDQEEYGIICEDDIVLSQDFFRLCEELLPRYKDEERIMQISARNESYRNDIPNTYVYSQCQHCWGWASWRRAWDKMDMTMAAVSRLSLSYYIERIGWLRGVFLYYGYHRVIKDIDHFNSWAMRWYLSILDADGLVICPGVNLALNIGMEGGTHYQSYGENPYKNLKLQNLTWPLQYNDSQTIDKKQKMHDSMTWFHVRYVGLKNKIRRRFSK